MLTVNYENLFQENIVMTIEHLKLETGRPRESILRDLKKIGYYSSYNARGKFYILKKMPIFDSNGLWKYRNAYFSIRRTLLDTTEYLVSVSAEGYTHDDLREILGIGIQNTLFQLVVAGRLVRRRIGENYVYFNNEYISVQEEKRRAKPIGTTVRKPARISKKQVMHELEPTMVIDILVAALRGHNNVDEVYSYLLQAGSPVTTKQIEMVFQKYEIGKKNS